MSNPTAMEYSSLHSDHPLLFTISTLVLPLFLLIIIFIVQSRRKLPLPPGPKGFPVIGNMLMMDRLTHPGLARLATQYGGLFHLKMGGLHVVTVSSPEMAREILQGQDGVFANRPPTVATTYLSYDRADMAFANYGPFWRQMRKVCVMKLFSRQRAQSWASVREEICSLIGKIEEGVESPVNVGDLVFGFARNVTYRAAFGSTADGKQDEFLKMLQEMSKLSVTFNVGDFIPWLGWIHGREFHEKLEKARGSLDGFIDKIIDDHAANKKSSQGCAEVDTDMVDELMAFYDEDGRSKGSADDFKITRNNIKALIMDVMFGGTETVASTVEWAMAELIRNWQEMKKVQQELADVVGFDRHVNDSDLENLTFLKCVVKETLRLHPPISLFHHETAADTAVAGYRIPAKTRVIFNAWAIFRDGSAWEDPEAFKPSRFLDGGAPDLKGSNFEFIPFGSGRRSCPGMQLGLYAVELAVAHLCHCFTWKLADGIKPSELNMNEALALVVSREIRLTAVPSRRLLGSVL